MTVHSRSSGSPESGLTLPPMRSARRAPSPASMAMRAASGSQNGPMATSPRPRSTIRFRKKVASLAAPPPGLSAPSEMTTGPPSTARASSSAASIDGLGGARRSRMPISSSASRRARALRLGFVAVGVDQHLGAHLGHVAPGEAVGDGDREHAVLALHRLEAVDERAGRFARGVHRGDHLAVDHRRHRANPLLDDRRAQVDQLERALQHVGVRILLVGDQQVGALDHRRREVAVRIELGADDDAGPDDGAHLLQQVALAVVVAVGDHRPVQAEQDHVDRQRLAQVGEQLLAQRLVAGARRRAARLRARRQALDDVPALGLAAQRARPRAARRNRTSGRDGCRPGSSRGRGTSPCRWAWARRCWFRWRCRR